MFVRYGWILAAAGALSLAAQARAAELTREQAVQRVLEQHPSLQSQSLLIRAAEHQAQTLAQDPPWTLTADVENLLGSGSLSGLRGAESTLRISRTIELGDKRGARRVLGAAEVARQRQGDSGLRVALAARTAQRFIRAAALQERLLILREHLQLAEQQQAVIQRWVEAGRSSDAELAQSRVAVVSARLLVEDAEHELESARTTLAALWGETEPTFAIASGSLQTLPPVAALQELDARLASRIAEQEFESESDSLQAQRQLAASSARPDLALSFGLRRLESIDDQALIASLSVPLGSAARALPGVARIDAELEALAARRQAATWEARQELRALHQELQHARHVVETHSGETLPIAQAALAASQRGFELGRFGYTVVNQAQQSLLELRLATLDARQRYHLLLVAIERLTAAQAGDPS